MSRELEFSRGEDDRIIDFLNQHCNLDGSRAYILNCIARPKENPQISHGDIPIFREIITDSDEIREKFRKISTLGRGYEPREGGDLDFRLYITANARDTESAFFDFQRELIDMQENISNGHGPTEDKIQRLDKEWISKLQSDKFSDDSYFIIDIDDPSLYQSTRKSLDDHTDTLHTIKTPNGYHLLTEPFNYTEFDMIDRHEEIELKKDSLLYLCFL